MLSLGKKGVYSLSLYIEFCKELISERAKRARHSLVCSIENRRYYILLASERSERDTLRSVQSRIADIYIYSILHILTIVFPDTRNVEYLPIFHGKFPKA